MLGVRDVLNITNPFIKSGDTEVTCERANSNSSELSSTVAGVVPVPSDIARPMLTLRWARYARMARFPAEVKRFDDSPSNSPS
jgi:hypothetical protein